MLTDDLCPVGAAVDQADRDRGDPGADRELVAAARAVSDDLADELMSEDDVTVRVIQRATRRIVDPELGMVHEMNIGRADRGTEHPQQKLTRTRYGIGDLAHRKCAPRRTAARMPPTNSRIIEIVSRNCETDCRNRPERSQGCAVRVRRRLGA